MARGLGVHRDGSNFGLRPIEIEVRRRLWAQLCILDVRFAEKLCREPTIDMNFYDTALPLSICDAELSELDEQHLSSKRGQTSTFKTHLHVEQEQERFSPFSVMTLTLVEAETARLMAQLHNTRYRARDSIFNNSSSSPNLARQSTSSAASRFEKVRWVNRLETRFQSVYKLNTLDSSNPKQLLVLETVEINIAKAKFVTRLLEWREVNGGMGDPHRDGEIAKLFREATSLATRGLSISHQYSGTPYSWYTKYLRDTYTTSFMAVCLASEAVLIEPEELHSAWSVLQQLFPLEATPSVAEASVSKSLFSKVLLKVRARHETTFRAASSHVMRGQAIYTAAGDIHHFPTSMSTNLPVSLPTRVGGVGTFQSSGNLFEDFDAIMQEPLWAPTLENVDNGYDGSWPADHQHASNLHTPITLTFTVSALRSTANISTDGPKSQ
ncbi:hypothetical protein K504DRAFT_188077 [Pleomassaria siparia CBS 279.74]|uniref:Xylanolytic transcriptional activator regulatory domain-containing protein n=1 Tax=Pleomassaria siparia CBS 279.74 TaxID=1314801 RepID=A0A6G1JRL9_9PLEO|nr:hypothetical protein K504DRAFT_188077 [Pleomassaria siparia CBS 279.74]